MISTDLAAVIYCKALHASDADAVLALCHPDFVMGWRDGKGKPHTLNRDGFTARVRARDAFPGEPSYEIQSVEAEDGIGQVKLWIDLGDRRFADQLGFVETETGWRLMTKLARVIDGPPL